MEQPDVPHIITLDRNKNINNHVTSLNLPELQTSQRVMLLVGRFVSSCNRCSDKMLYSWPRVQSSRLLRHAECPHLQATTPRGNQKRANCLFSPVTCFEYTSSLRRRPHRRNWLQAVGFMQLEYICMKPKFFGVGAIFFCSVHADLHRIVCTSWCV
jgi:hypothetical protein